MTFGYQNLTYQKTDEQREERQKVPCGHAPAGVLIISKEGSS